MALPHRYIMPSDMPLVDDRPYYVTIATDRRAYLARSKRYENAVEVDRQILAHIFELTRAMDLPIIREGN